jgi:hypothetical protein
MHVAPPAAVFPVLVTAEARPPIHLDRPLEDDELAALLASVLLDPIMNPHLDWLAVGEFAPKAMWAQNAPSPEQGKFVEANGGSQALGQRVNELCWEWVRAGLLVPEREYQFRLSERGREILADVEAEGRVLDRTWFGERLSAIEGPLAAVVTGYAAEAHEAMLAGLYRSAAVMIGVASEALVFALADELRVRRSRFTLSSLPQRASALQTLDWEARAFRERGGLIKGELIAVGASARWIDELPGLLAEGNAIRLLRNESGHPTGEDVVRRQAIGLFVLFPLVAQAVSVTTSALAAVPHDTSAAEA